MHGEEPVQYALGFKHPRKHTQPAVGMWRHAVGQQGWGLDPEVGARRQKRLDPLFAFFGFEAADRIDETAARAQPIQQSRPDGRDGGRLPVA